MRRFAYLLFAALLLTACDDHPQEPLRMGINPWPGYEYLYLAERLKLFEQEGVQVRVVQFSSLNDARRAYERGQIDGFGGTLVELLMSRQNSPRQAQVVYVPDYSNGGDLIVAHHRFNTLEELKGQRIAVEPGTLNTYVLTRALENHGLKITDVQLVALPQPDMQRALERRDIEAAVTYPPFSVEMLKHPELHSLFDTREIPGEVLDVLVVDQQVIDSRRDEVRAMLRAFDSAFRYTHEHPDEAYAIMAEREGLSPEEFRSAIENDLKTLGLADQTRFFAEPTELLPALRNSQEVLLRSGELSKEQPLEQLISPVVLGL